MCDVLNDPKNLQQHVEMFHRDTQTKFVRNRRNQTNRDTATQMTKTGCYVARANDHSIGPRSYVTAEKYHQIRHEKAVVIQCFIRQTFAKRVFRKLREERDARLKKMADVSDINFNCGYN